MSMRLTIMEQMAQVAREHGKMLAPLSDDLALQESGLDSLGIAVLSLAWKTNSTLTRLRLPKRSNCR